MDTIHDFLKPGFFCNSGIIIDGKTEIQIIDSLALEAALNRPNVPDPGATVVVDGADDTIWSRYASNGTQLYLEDVENAGRPAGWDPENFSALINGAAYNISAATDGSGATLDMNSAAEFEAAEITGSMTIDVRRHHVEEDSDTAQYDLTISTGGKTYKYVNLPGTGTSGPGATISNTIKLQSHWGSGVRFTSFRIEE